MLVKWPLKTWPWHWCDLEVGGYIILSWFMCNLYQISNVYSLWKTHQERVKHTVVIMQGCHSRENVVPEIVKTLFCKVYACHVNADWIVIELTWISEMKWTHWGLSTCIAGLVQGCSIPIGNAVEILQSCTKPLIYFSVNWVIIGRCNSFSSVGG